MLVESSRDSKARAFKLIDVLARVRVFAMFPCFTPVRLHYNINDIEHDIWAKAEQIYRAIDKRCKPAHISASLLWRCLTGSACKEVPKINSMLSITYQYTPFQDSVRPMQSTLTMLGLFKDGRICSTAC